MLRFMSYNINDGLSSNVAYAILEDRRGFILSTACSIAPRVSGDRVKLLSELVKQSGQYI